MILGSLALENLNITIIITLLITLGHLQILMNNINAIKESKNE